ncbi:hypothetical protein DFJ43DRAFT_1035416 [Lentinula guzmanii]|uniref:Uncharacterized protein n=1 Tax=Lentinula guzmanii TaxID=2804957 RepID=A0AA38N637_9AGAR|nr:hypothetical protein DFJ43DRAFT_1035416 [Lentinula guzmanii]
MMKKDNDPDGVQQRSKLIFKLENYLQNATAYIPCILIIGYFVKFDRGSKEKVKYKIKLPFRRRGKAEELRLQKKKEERIRREAARKAEEEEEAKEEKKKREAEERKKKEEEERKKREEEERLKEEERRRKDEERLAKEKEEKEEKTGLSVDRQTRQENHPIDVDSLRGWEEAEANQNDSVERRSRKRRSQSWGRW